MAYRVELTVPAQRDREEIVSYLAVDLASPQAARGFLEEFDRKVEMASGMPGSFPLCRQGDLANRGYRRALVGNYLFIYATDRRRKVVTILRVFHGMQDYARLL